MSNTFDMSKILAEAMTHVEQESKSKPVSKK